MNIPEWGGGLYRKGRPSSGAKRLIFEQGRDQRLPISETLVDYYVKAWYQCHQIPEKVYRKALREVEILKGNIGSKAGTELTSITVPAVHTREDQQHVRKTVENEPVRKTTENEPLYATPVKRKKASNHDSKENRDTKVGFQIDDKQETTDNTQEKSYSKDEVDALLAEKDRVIEQKSKELAKLKTLMDRLESDNKAIHENFQRATIEIEELRTRLSQVAGDKIEEGNPNIADLSNPNRPTEIGPKFTEIYDNQWTDAFESLKSSKLPEETIVTLLFNIVKESYGYCKKQLQKQHLCIRDLLTCPDVQDKEAARRFYGTLSKQEQAYRKNKLFLVMREARNYCAKDAAKHIGESFAKFELPDILQTVGFRQDTKIPGYLVKYAQKCAEVSWYMVICEPAVAPFASSRGMTFDTNLFKPYTSQPKSPEDTVLMTVWPALHLYQGGPLLTKGVAQPEGAKQKRVGEQRQKTTNMKQ